MKTIVKRALGPGLSEVIARIKRGDKQPLGRKSYSQGAEDLLVDNLFYELGVSSPAYLDIGAYDPRHFSNTYYFYEKGFQGICIEPDPTRAANIASARPRDTVLNGGIGDGTTTKAKFYALSIPTLSTFDENSARELVDKREASIERELELPLFTVAEVADKYFPNGIDFMSLDVEGWDARILASMDFEKVRPKVICVETIDYFSREKTDEIAEILLSTGYVVYADTRINTIFRDTRVKSVI